MRLATHIHIIKEVNTVIVYVNSEIVWYFVRLYHDVVDHSLVSVGIPEIAGRHAVLLPEDFGKIAWIRKSGFISNVCNGKIWVLQ